jgi:hypothetical protein
MRFQYKQILVAIHSMPAGGKRAVGAFVLLSVIAGALVARPYIIRSRLPYFEVADSYNDYPRAYKFTVLVQRPMTDDEMRFVSRDLSRRAGGQSVEVAYVTQSIDPRQGWVATCSYPAGTVCRPSDSGCPPPY